MKPTTKDRLTKFGKNSLEFLIELGGAYLVSKGASHFIGDQLYVQVPAIMSGYKTAEYGINLVKHHFMDKEKYQKPNFVHDVAVPIVTLTALGKGLSYLNLE